MCGIAGIFHLDSSPIDAGQLRQLTSAQSHRGPDGDGYFVDGNLGLGHRRLAIIDLECGAQPLSNEDESVWVSFNGEIYNYRELRGELAGRGHTFRTLSDTEVLVHAYEEWGDRFVERLRGMFAFALWDARRRRLLLARDRMGIKPLVYLESGAQFAFASELQALRSLDGFDDSVNLEALDLYLHLQYIPAPLSIYQGVQKLPPAHYLVIDADRGVQGPFRYWKLAFEPDRGLTEAAWVERLDAALRDAVRVHLVSDVRFGAFLSGGVDSSLVVAYMAELLDEPVSTFTIGFDDDEYDERAPAREVSNVLGTDHHERLIHAEGLTILPQLVAHYGEPFADSSAIATYYVSEVAREQVKMVLSGDGGDEVFGGYSYYAKMLRQFPPPANRRQAARRQVGRALRALRVRPAAPTVSNAWYHRSPFFSADIRQQLWRPELSGVMAASHAWNEQQFRAAGRSDVLTQCQTVDLNTYLPFDNLAKVDVASMCHSLEVRVPLLDHLLLEEAARIPPEMRVRLSGAGSTDKYLLKSVAGRFLPREILHRKKMGFSLPISSWIASDWRNEVRERLMDPAAGLSEFFSPDFVAGLLSAHGTSADHGHRIWALLFFAEWRASQQRGAARANVA